jgi:hypothetical protein
MEGAVYIDHHLTLLALKEAIANITRNTPPIELSRVFANKTCRPVSSSTWGQFPTFVVNLKVSVRNPSSLMYRDSLNTLTVYCRPT